MPPARCACGRFKASGVASCKACCASEASEIVTLPAPPPEASPPAPLLEAAQPAPLPEAAEVVPSPPAPPPKADRDRDAKRFETAAAAAAAVLLNFSHEEGVLLSFTRHRKYTLGKLDHIARKFEEHVKQLEAFGNQMMTTPENDVVGLFHKIETLKVQFAANMTEAVQSVPQIVFLDRDLSVPLHPLIQRALSAVSASAALCDVDALAAACPDASAGGKGSSSSAAAAPPEVSARVGGAGDITEVLSTDEDAA